MMSTTSSVTFFTSASGAISRLGLRAAAPAA
jgi:hypothetical protein